VKPELIIKGGMIAWFAMGDSNASIPTPQPVLFRPMFGSYGAALHHTSLLFVSAAAREADVPASLSLRKLPVAVKKCRKIVYTREDAEFLVRRQALPAERIIGVATGGCPHTAIREDASVNLEACAVLLRRLPDLDLLLIESGGDNLAATFSPELVDATIYVINVAEGDKIPRKGGPGSPTPDFWSSTKSTSLPP
jgi:hypothetical protein